MVVVVLLLEVVVAVMIVAVVVMLYPEAPGGCQRACWVQHKRRFMLYPAPGIGAWRTRTGRWRERMKQSSGTRMR